MHNEPNVKSCVSKLVFKCPFHSGSCFYYFLGGGCFSPRGTLLTVTQKLVDSLEPREKVTTYWCSGHGLPPGHTGARIQDGHWARIPELRRSRCRGLPTCRAFRRILIIVILRKNRKNRWRVLSCVHYSSSSNTDRKNANMPGTCSPAPATRSHRHSPAPCHPAPATRSHRHSPAPRHTRSHRQQFPLPLPASSIQLGSY